MAGKIRMNVTFTLDNPADMPNIRDLSGGAAIYFANETEKIARDMEKRMKDQNAFEDAKINSLYFTDQNIMLIRTRKVELGINEFEVEELIARLNNIQQQMYYKGAQKQEIRRLNRILAIAIGKKNGLDINGTNEDLKFMMKYEEKYCSKEDNNDPEKES